MNIVQAQNFHTDKLLEACSIWTLKLDKLNGFCNGEYEAETGSGVIILQIEAIFMESHLFIIQAYYRESERKKLPHQSLLIKY